MAGLIRRPNGGAVAQPGVRTTKPTVEGRQLANDDWSGTLLSPSDAQLTDDASAIAHCVKDETGVRRRSDGSSYRLRIGWMAFAEHVVVNRMEQPLVRGADSKLHTAGPYKLASSERYEASSAPRRRRGTVPGDGSSGGSSDSAGPGVSSPFAEIPKQFKAGYYSLSFLPEKVRAGVLERVREATVFTGESIRYDNGDRYEVALLGLSSTGAIVVTATTHRDTTDWNVDQYVYEWVRCTDQLGPGSAPSRPRLRSGS